MHARTFAPVAVALLWAAAAGSAPAGASPGQPDAVVRRQAPSGPPVPIADFNGDGISDLAVASPGEDVGAIPWAGAVHVLFGSAIGVTGFGSQLFHQGSPGISSEPEVADFFGRALATGDYDIDGYTDLAIGVPRETVGNVGTTGVVQLLYGSPAGLSAARSQTITQDSPGVDDVAEQNDGFGEALATGDYDGDGVDDLAIGAGSETVDGHEAAGAVHVLYGRPQVGIAGDGSVTLTQAGGVVPSDPEKGDRFGSALAAGDFDSDGVDDLVAGAPGEAFGPVGQAGAVTVFRGLPDDGITAVGAALISQETAGVPGVSELEDIFGTALVTGDFTGDGRDDLAIGAPYESVGLLARAGAVTMVPGSTVGLTGAGTQLLTQDVGDLPGVAEPSDQFGSTLASGGHNGDGVDDLAIGIPGEAVGLTGAAGAVNVVYGAEPGAWPVGSDLFVQGGGGVGSLPGLVDRFGEALATGDFDGEGHDDLVVGVPSEDAGPLMEAGMIHVLKGTSAGVTGTGSRTLTQASPGISSALEGGDSFGAALGALPPAAP